MWPQGGGPYGKQVTRGQDLTGKDFSGQTLVKQDFKTVLRLHIWPFFFVILALTFFFLLHRMLEEIHESFGISVPRLACLFFACLFEW